MTFGKTPNLKNTNFLFLEIFNETTEIYRSVNALDKQNFTALTFGRMFNSPSERFCR